MTEIPKWVTPEIKEHYNIEVKHIGKYRYTMLTPKKKPVRKVRPPSKDSLAQKKAR